MRKITIKARADYHLDLQIQELSDMLGCSRSAVIRMLCKRTINEMQDKDGNWIIPKGAYKGKDIKAASIGKSNENPVDPVRDPSG